jgi:hypothetical protein
MLEKMFELGERGLTTVMGMLGALGTGRGLEGVCRDWGENEHMNFTSSNFWRRRQFSARDTQPAPESPRPWAMMTVAVCFLTAGTMRGGRVAIVKACDETFQIRKRGVERCL